MDGPLLGIDQQLLTHGAAATSVVDAKVAGDAEQPEPEFFLSTRSPVEMFEGAYGRLLHQLLGHGYPDDESA